MDKSITGKSPRIRVRTASPFANPGANGSRIRVQFSVQAYREGTAQPATDSELKSLR